MGGYRSPDFTAIFLEIFAPKGSPAAAWRAILGAHRPPRQRVFSASRLSVWRRTKGMLTGSRPITGHQSRVTPPGAGNVIGPV